MLELHWSARMSLCLERALQVTTPPTRSEGLESLEYSEHNVDSRDSYISKLTAFVNSHQWSNANNKCVDRVDTTWSPGEPRFELPAVLDVSVGHTNWTKGSCATPITARHHVLLA